MEHAFLYLQALARPVITPASTALAARTANPALVDSFPPLMDRTLAPLALLELPLAASLLLQAVFLAILVPQATMEFARNAPPERIRPSQEPPNAFPATLALSPTQPVVLAAHIALEDHTRAQAPPFVHNARLDNTRFLELTRASLALRDLMHQQALRSANDAPQIHMRPLDLDIASHAPLAPLAPQGHLRASKPTICIYLCNCDK